MASHYLSQSHESRASVEMILASTFTLEEPRVAVEVTNRYSMCSKMDHLVIS
jgi:hypothetical protein